MLKKIISILLISFFLLSHSAFAATTQIGIINTELIIKNSKLYSELRKAEDELNELQKSFEKEYQARLLKLQEAMNQKKSPMELQQLEQMYQLELREQQLNAQKVYTTKQHELENMRQGLREKVEKAIQEIAKQKKLDYVIDKQAMFYGGTDITQDVLDKIK